MPLSGRKVPPRAVEKELATVASPISGREVELPAMWNRMFEPRVLTDYGPDGFAALGALPGAESLEWCYGCGKCIPVCPVDVVGEYGPRKLHRKVQTGADLLADPDLWLCTTCGNCLRVCPKQVDMVQVMPAAREAALAGGGPVPGELAEVFEKTFRYGNALGANPRRRAEWAAAAGRGDAERRGESAEPARVLGRDHRGGCQRGREGGRGVPGAADRRSGDDQPPRAAARPPGARAGPGQPRRFPAARAHRGPR